jgi:class 3 adenylate cyclase
MEYVPRIAWSPEGTDEEERRQTIEAWIGIYEEKYGTGALIEWFVPSAADDPSFVEWWGRFERLSMSPGSAIDVISVAGDIDVRDILPSVQAPTLVIGHEGDKILFREAHQYMADQIPDARFVEFPGIDHFAWREEDGATQEIQEFLTGERSERETERVLATILLTDVVRSTDRAAELGDKQWNELLDRHYTVTNRTLDQFRGHLVDTTGDGIIATFDGPARAIRCAAAITDAVREIGLEVRAGLHTGEVEVRGDRLAGIAVHTAARVSSLADPGEVLVSRTVKDLVAGSGIGFAERGSHVLKGVPGEWELFAAT